MSMEVKILKAYNGDSIVLRFSDENNVKRNIMIDGGTDKTYYYKNKKGKLEDGDLKKEIKRIVDQGEQIDLLILTHIDDDHVGGLLKWIENDKNFSNIVKKVWFNSGKLIEESIKNSKYEGKVLHISEKTNDTSIKQGITFEEYVLNANIWERKLIISGEKIKLFNLEFFILTPTIKVLKTLLVKWVKQYPEYLTSAKNDYDLKLEALMNENDFVSDNSPYNASSISFILKYNGKQMLFLADAHSNDVIDGLKKFGFDINNKIDVELLKVSHHGSKFNTSNELLSVINASLFIISTDGNIHNHPDKQCLARIIRSKKDAKIMFNYSEKISEIFFPEEIEKYIFKALPLENKLII